MFRVELVELRFQQAEGVGSSYFRCYAPIVFKHLNIASRDLFLVVWLYLGLLKCWDVCFLLAGGVLLRFVVSLGNPIKNNANVNVCGDEASSIILLH